MNLAKGDYCGRENILFMDTIYISMLYIIFFANFALYCKLPAIQIKYKQKPPTINFGLHIPSRPFPSSF